MVERFIEYSAGNNLFSDKSRIITTVSGGIDSMVLANLFLEAGMKPAIAHCNFSLRGNESDGDEEFVKEFASVNGLEFYTVRFDTHDYAERNRMSIQMAARELRYNWFEEIRSNFGYEVVAVAHNLNDNVETFLINLLRGTGISGLTGMKPKNENIIRPLLFASREEIKAYAASHDISFREDSSNAQVKYVRNKIRHKVIPLLKEVNPDALTAITSTIEHLNGSSEIINGTIDTLRSELFSVKGDETHIPADRLKKLNPEKSYLFELFRPYGLSAHQVDELIDLINGSVGKMMYITGYRLIKDRNDLILTEIKTETKPEISFNSFTEMSNSGMFKSVKICQSDVVNKEADQSIAFLDADLISYPLIYRKWKEGDRFYPFGMNGVKKISDFLVDKKVSRAEKENVMVLLSEENIIWVAGYRTDNRYRVTEETKNVLVISM